MLRLGLIALSALLLTGGLSAQDKMKDVLRIRQNLENPNYDDPKMDIPKVEMISFETNKIQPLLTYDQAQKFTVFSAKIGRASCRERV